MAGDFVPRHLPHASGPRYEILSLKKKKLVDQPIYTWKERNKGNRSFVRLDPQLEGKLKRGAMGHRRNMC